MLSECRRFKTQLGGPCRHDFSWNAAKPVLNLRDEGVVFETEPRGEIDLRQAGIRPALLQPIPRLFPQLPGFRRNLALRLFSQSLLMFSPFHDY